MTGHLLMGSQLGSNERRLDRQSPWTRGLDEALFSMPGVDHALMLYERARCSSLALSAVLAAPPVLDATVAAKADWCGYVALAQLLLEWPRCRECGVIGIAGPPGAGKSSLALILERLFGLLGRSDVIHVSLDDFYLSPPERESLGFPWRAAPGTHDIHMLRGFISALRSLDTDLHVPVYDKALDRRMPFRVFKKPVSRCLFEGWFVGAGLPGYTELSDALDCLLYLDMPYRQARNERLRRERGLRSNGRGGFSERDTQQFWDQVLGPGIRSWVQPIRRTANLVLRIGPDHAITGCRVRKNSRYRESD